MAQSVTTVFLVIASAATLSAAPGTPFKRTHVPEDFIDGMATTTANGAPIYRAWLGGVIPYQFASSFNASQLAMINAIMKEIQAKTCVCFRQKTSQDPSYLKIQSGGDCASMIGQDSLGGGQPFILGPYCFGWNGGTIRHELMHALGFIHEHDRPDRDNYVQILRENIDLDDIQFERHFNKFNVFEVVDMGTPYDYDSILHFDQFAFSRNPNKLPTIVAKNGQPFGKGEEFSSNDILKINKLYECSTRIVRVC